VEEHAADAQQAGDENRDQRRVDVDRAPSSSGSAARTAA
jgi:hypothetical protein